MKRLACLLFTLSLSIPVLAAPPSAESVNQLLTLTRVERVASGAQQGLENVIRNAIAQAMQGKTLTPKGQQIIDKYAADIRGTIQKEINWTKMKESYVKLYTETFSQDEINGLITFYKSPTGQMLLDRMPEVTQKAAQINQQQLGPVVEKLKVSLKKAVEDAQAAK